MPPPRDGSSQLPVKPSKLSSTIHIVTSQLAADISESDTEQKFDKYSPARITISK